MNPGDCYQLLGLKLGASLAEVKASYRYLARQYHPDINSGQQAQTKFIEVTNAYKFLLNVVESSTSEELNQFKTAFTPDQAENPKRSEHQSASFNTYSRSDATGTTSRATRKPAVRANLSDDQQLKQASYQQLQRLLKHQRFPQAIALAEGLAQRLPQDLEVRQWQAITYQGLGRYFIHEKQLDKARSYLKKALRTDPHNRFLWAEVERDFRRIEQAV